MPGWRRGDNEETVENETVLALSGDESADSIGQDTAFERVFDILGG